MTHYIQGPNDGLCGFYAVLNCLSYMEERKLLPGRLPIDEQARFDGAVEALSSIKGVSLLNVRGGGLAGGITGDKLTALLTVLCKQWELKLAPKYENHHGKRTRLDVYSTFEAEENLDKRFGMIAAIERGTHWVAVVRRGGNLVAMDCRLHHRRFFDPGSFYQKEAILLKFSDD